MEIRTDALETMRIAMANIIKELNRHFLENDNLPRKEFNKIQ
jgi:hypothetical protein